MVSKGEKLEFLNKLIPYFRDLPDTCFNSNKGDIAIDEHPPIGNFGAHVARACLEPSEFDPNHFSNNTGQVLWEHHMGKRFTTFTRPGAPVSPFIPTKWKIKPFDFLVSLRSAVEEGEEPPLSHEERINDIEKMVNRLSFNQDLLRDMVEEIVLILDKGNSQHE